MVDVDVSRQWRPVAGEDGKMRNSTVGGYRIQGRRNTLCHCIAQRALSDPANGSKRTEIAGLGTQAS